MAYDAAKLRDLIKDQNIELATPLARKRMPCPLCGSFNLIGVFEAQGTQQIVLWQSEVGMTHEWEDIDSMRITKGPLVSTECKACKSRFDTNLVEY